MPFPEHPMKAPHPFKNHKEKTSLKKQQEVTKKTCKWQAKGTYYQKGLKQSQRLFPENVH
jgi:hypothetical protein